MPEYMLLPISTARRERGGRYVWSRNAIQPPHLHSLHLLDTTATDNIRVQSFIPLNKTCVGSARVGTISRPDAAKV